MGRRRALAEDGYAVVKAVFTADEVAESGRAFDRIWQEGLRHPRSFRHGNVFYRIADDPAVGRMVRYMQWPAYIDPVLDRFRQDPRMLAIVAPLLGADLKQIINQMHWKPPGAAMTEFGYHQDIRFRRPRTAYRDPANSYLQTGIAIDAHRRENGAMLVYPGSHRLGELDLGEGRVMDRPLDDDDLHQGRPRSGFGARRSTSIRATSPSGTCYTVHGSGPNTSGGDRRFYINGYVRASMCDRGEWTFRDGRPVALGEPVLVHYEDLLVRPDPHYVDD